MKLKHTVMMFQDVQTRNLLTRTSPGAPRRAGFPTRPQRAKSRVVLSVLRRGFEVHDALNKARHVCERRRESEAAVSCENAAGDVFEHPERPEQ
jgi:hypothetical protein